MVSLVNSNRYFKKVMISLLWNFFQKLKAKWRLPNSLYEASIIQIPKPDNDITRKKNSSPSYEYRYKNLQQNISKSNLTMCKTNYILQSNGIYSTYARVQHSKNQLIKFIISSVQLLSCVRLFATPWITEGQASLSITNSRSLLKHRSIESVMPSSHLILFVVPFSSCPQSLPATGSFPMSQLFAWVAKVLEFQLQHQSFQWTPRTDLL